MENRVTTAVFVTFVTACIALAVSFYNIAPVVTDDTLCVTLMDGNTVWGRLVIDDGSELWNGPNYKSMAFHSLDDGVALHNREWVDDRLGTILRVVDINGDVKEGVLIKC